MIINTLNKIVYIGNGQVTEFSYPFVINSQEDIKVLLVSPEGQEILISENYFVDTSKNTVFYPGYSPGQQPPEIEVPPVLPIGWKILLYRDVKETQEVDFGNRWPFYIIEKAFDKVTMLVQQFAEKIGRCIVFPISENFKGELPTPIKPSASVCINEDGSGLRYGPNPDDAGAALLVSKEARTIAKEARDTADGIDAKATSALTDSEDAQERVEVLEERIENLELSDAETLNGKNSEAIINEAVARSDSHLLNHTQLNRIRLNKEVIELGDVRYPGLKTAKSYLMLICVKAGLTDEVEPVWGSIGSTQVDGGVTWRLADLRRVSDGILGEIKAFPFVQAPTGWIAVDTGKILSRKAYPELWEHAQSNGNLISDEEWLALEVEQTSVPYFSMGDANTTFRTPKIVDFIRGVNGEREFLEWQGDAIRNIEGNYNPYGISYGAIANHSNSVALTTGAFKTGTIRSYAVGYTTSYSGFDLGFDASLVVPTAEENRPKNVSFLYCIKVFDYYDNTGMVDIVNLAKDVTTFNTRLDEIKNKNGFTIIYPNGGTKVQPAEITINSRYVEENPFKGHMVMCQAEVLVGNYWGITGFLYVSGGQGIAASHLMPDDKIIVQTGFNYTRTSYGSYSGHPFPDSIARTTIPCRVKVWKVG